MKLKSSRYLLIIFTLLFSCKTIEFSEAYRNHLTELQLNGHRVINQGGVITHNDYHTLPDGVFRSLPGEFRIAGLTDHLEVVQDTLGKIKYTGNIYTGNKLPANLDKPSKLSTGEYLRVLHSKVYKASINEKRKLGLKENSMPGYMNMTAFIEPYDYDEIIQTQYAQSWVSWIGEYNINLEDLEQKTELNKKLKTDLDDANKVINHLVLEEKNIKKAIVQTDARAERLRREYQRLRRQKLESEIDFNTNLNITYDYQKDPLKPYYDNNLVDITNYNWPINDGVSNKTLHPAAVDAFDKAHKMFKNPENYFDSQFAAKVKLLDSPEIFSASRTIIHQATITSNPNAAGWLNSNHAMGLSMDMTFANKNYNVRSENPSESQKANYAVFKKVMEQAGFVNTTSESVWRERNHFTVEKFASKKDGIPIDDPNSSRRERILNETANFFEGFADTADFQGKELENKIKEVANGNAELIEKLGNLEEKIEEKRKDIEKELKKLKDSRSKMKMWEKARNKEKDRIARERRRARDDRGCLAKEMDLKAVEFQMMPVSNSIKHWDCGPHGC